MYSQPPQLTGGGRRAPFGRGRGGEDLAKGTVRKDALAASLATLVALDDTGLVEPYVVLVLADEGIARDYPAHRDKLRQFIDPFVLAGTKT